MKKLLILTAVILLTGSTMGCNCFDRLFRRGAPADECMPVCGAPCAECESGCPTGGCPTGGCATGGCAACAAAPGAVPETFAPAPGPTQ
jgi:hypothetical protein